MKAFARRCWSGFRKVFFEPDDFAKGCQAIINNLEQVPADGNPNFTEAETAELVECVHEKYGSLYDFIDGNDAISASALVRVSHRLASLRIILAKLEATQ